MNLKKNIHSFEPFEDTSLNTFAIKLPRSVVYIISLQPLFSYAPLNNGAGHIPSQTHRHQLLEANAAQSEGASFLVSLFDLSGASEKAYYFSSLRYFFIGLPGLRMFLVSSLFPDISLLALSLPKN